MNKVVNLYFSNFFSYFLIFYFPCFLKLSLPPEIEVDNTSAVEAVIKSDKYRLSLLNEEAELTSKLEDGDITVSGRLKEVLFSSSLVF